MDFAPIVSYSGMTHLVNPHPAGVRLPPRRTKTLCEFHIRIEESNKADGRECEFCKKEIAEHERRWGNHA